MSQAFSPAAIIGAVQDIFPQSRRGQWSIVDENGQALLTFTSFLELSYAGSAHAPDLPLEGGEFFTYNKVGKAARIRATLALQGPEDELRRALRTLRELERAAKVVSVQTPAGLLASTTLVGLNWKRSREGGLGLLVAELTLKEVRRVEADPGRIPLRDAADPTRAGFQDGGKVQLRELRLAVREALVRYAGVVG